MNKFSMRPVIFALALILIGLFAFIRSVVPLPGESSSPSNDSPVAQSEE